MSMRQVVDKAEAEAKTIAPPSSHKKKKTPFGEFSFLIILGVFFTYLALIFMLMCLFAKDQKQKAER